MKLKTTIALSLTFLSINAFAYIASPGVKVENRIIHCSHPGKCGFIERDDLAKKEREKFVLSKKKGGAGTALSANSDLLETYAFCNNVMAGVGEETKITGYHVVNIENNSGKIERFTKKYELYSGDDDVYYQEDITLNPGDYYTNSFYSFEYVTRNKAGIYNIVATTTVDGDGKGLDIHSAQLSVLQ